MRFRASVQRTAGITYSRVTGNGQHCDWPRYHVREPAPRTSPRKATDARATTRPHPRSPLRARLQRPPGRRPLRRRPAARPARPCREEQLRRGPRVRRRGRERPRRQPAAVPQDARRGERRRRALRADIGVEVQPLHAQARARRRLQVDAAPPRHPRRLHHRARRRLPHRQAHGGDHRERRRVLQRKSCPGGRPRDARGGLAWLLGRQPHPVRLHPRLRARRREEAPEARGGRRHRPRRGAHIRPRRVRQGHHRDRARPQRRRHRQPHGSPLVQERRSHPAHQRGLHGHVAVGRGREGRRPAGARRGRLPRDRLEGVVRPRAVAAALTRAKARPPAPRGQLLPPERSGQVPQLSTRPLRAGLQERQILLLRLPVADEARPGSLRRPEAQRAPLRAPRRRPAPRQRPHSVQHPRPRASRRRGTRRGRERAEQPARDDRGRTGRCAPPARPSLPPHGDDGAGHQRCAAARARAQGAPRAPGAGGLGGAGRALGAARGPRRRGHDHGLRRGDERVPRHERTDGVEGLHQLLREGDRRRPRTGHDPLHDPDA